MHHNSGQSWTMHCTLTAGLFVPAVRHASVSGDFVVLAGTVGTHTPGLELARMPGVPGTC